MNSIILSYRTAVSGIQGQKKTRNSYLLSVGHLNEQFWCFYTTVANVLFLFFLPCLGIAELMLITVNQISVHREFFNLSSNKIIRIFPIIIVFLAASSSASFIFLPLSWKTAVVQALDLPLFSVNLHHHHIRICPHYNE